MIDYPPEFSDQRTHSTDREMAAMRRALIAKRIAIGLACLSVLTLLVAAAVGVLLIRGTQQTNTPKIDSSAETLKIIEGCTTPGRACYERGQTQLKDVVGQLNQYGIFVAACASGPVARTDDEITRCVVAKLRALPHKP